MTHLPTVRATGPADLLALVPGFLGFHPEDSVVLITVGDARQPFHARVDLPTDPVATEELAAYLTRVSVRGGVRSVAVVVYSDDDVLAEELLEELAGRLEDEGVDVACGLRADGERWWALGRGGGGPGTPYDLSCHPLMARTVVDGTVVLASRRALADTLVGDATAVAEVEARVGQVVARLGDTRPALVAEGRWVRQQVRRHLADDGAALDASEVARLAVLFMLSVEVRDVAWAEMDHANAAKHVDLWRDVVRRTPPDLRAAPAALLAFAAWLSGNGALAWCAVDLAQEAQPDYGLAGLICHALSGAVPPSVWEPLSPDAVTLFATGDTA
ncbi:MAG: DUF4192 domain-containing protein [Nocardioidaceae bacterium]